MIRFVLLAAAAALVGCGDMSQSEHPVRSTAADTVYVSPLAPIGGSLDLPDEYQFADITDMVAGPLGELFVVDQRFIRIQVFDSSGVYVRTLGREGRGPGEFLIPRQIGIRDSLIVVSDEGRRQFVYLDLAGVELGSILMRGGGGHFFDGIWVDTNGKVYDGRQGWGANADNNFVVALPPFWENQDQVDTIPIAARTEREIVFEGSFGRVDLVAQPLSMRTLWSVLSDGVVISSNGSACVFEHHALGSRMADLECDIELVPIPRAIADKAYQDSADELELRAVNLDVQPSEYLRRLRQPENYPRFAALAVDEDDRIWVGWRSSSSDTLYVRVLNRSTGLHAETVYALPLEDGTRVETMTIGGGWLYMVQHDDLRLERIARFRLDAAR